MMIEFAKIEEVNGRLKAVDIKGKSYNTVNQRVLAFRELFPDGRIVTEMLENEDGRCIFRACVYDGEALIATGTAYEVENSTYINKTSYIENCETSAVGRALGFIGIGAVESIASADEVQAAMEQQNRFRPLKRAEQQALAKALSDSGKSIFDFKDIIANAQGWADITVSMFDQIMRRLESAEDDCFTASPGDQKEQ